MMDGLLNELLETFPIDQIGWTLIHATWIITFIAITFALVDHTISRMTQRSEMRYLSAVAGLSAILATVPIVFFSVPQYHGVRSEPLPAGSILTSGVYPDSQEQDPVQVSAVAMAELPLSTGTPREYPASEYRRLDDLKPSSHLFSSPKQTHSSPLQSGKETWLELAERFFGPRLRLIVSLWLSGLTLFLLRMCVGLRSVRRLKQSADFNVPNWLRQACSDYSRAMGLRRVVGVGQSADVAMPVAVGIVRPLILLPIATVNGLSTTQVKAIIAHELAHIQRHDNFISLLQVLTESILFFHPGMWWVSGIIRQQREHCCDDLAIEALGDRRSYLDSLLALEEFTGRAPAGVSAASGGSLLRRFRRLTNNGIQRRQSSRSIRSVISAGLLFTLFIGGVIAVSSGLQGAAISSEPSLSAGPDDDKTEPAKDMSNVEAELTLRGSLVRPSGEPFVSHSIEIDFRWRNDDGKSVHRKSQTTKTDEQGGFRVDVTELPGHAKSVRVTLSGEGFVAIERRKKGTPVGPWELRKIVVSETRTVSSRVIDPNGLPVPDAKIDVYAHPHFHNTHETNADGRFACELPQDVDIGVMVRSSKGAIHRVVMPADADRWGDIYLKHGATLSGTVIDRDGQPISGCIVAARSDDTQAVGAAMEYGTYGAGTLHVETLAITDAKGRYEFTPLLGHFIVRFADPGDCFRRNSKEYKKCVVAPPMVPTPIRLDSYGQRTLNLVEAPTTTLSGRIVNDAGLPVADIQVTVLQPPAQSGYYSRLGTAKTDSDGNYAVTLPMPLTRVSINVQSGHAEKTAWPAISIDGAKCRRENVWFNDFDGSVTTIDWKLYSKDSKPDYAASVPPGQQPSSDPNIALLEQKILDARAAWKAAIAGASTPEEKAKVGKTLDPKKVIGAFAEKLEQQHRGSRAALGAIHWIQLRTAQTTDAELRARSERVVEVLMEHYIRHHDLDRVLPAMTAVNVLSNSQALLRAAIEKSPHPHVRAEAMYQLADYLFSLNHMATMVDGAIVANERLMTIQSAATRKSMEEDNKRYRNLQKVLAIRTVAARQQEAMNLLDLIIARYPNVFPPIRWFVGRADVEMVLQPDSSRQWYPWTPARRAECRKFQLTRLKLQHEAPEIEALDLYHRRIRLSDFLGRVVVLTVNHGTVSETDMYNTCRELQEEFRDQPVAVLSVVTSDASGGYSVRDIVRETKITWPIFRDTPGGSIARHWCTDGSPTAYLIDPNGIIVQQSTGYTCVNAGTKIAVQKMLDATVAPQN